MRLLGSVVIFACLCAPALLPAADKPTRQQLDFFEKKIRPVLVESCYKCHSADSKELGAKLRLDLREGLLKGGESGPAIVPGEPGEGTLLSALEYRDSEMPPDGKLSDAVIADFRRWIKMGAPDPRDGSMSPPASEKKTTAVHSSDLWSLKPIVASEPPAVQQAGWAKSDIDRFVLARLERENLQPAPDARANVLIRRLTFDLVGLPPTLEQQQRFQQVISTNPDVAVQQLTDELLASPQFGERWGRHWLDVVRYAESTGNSRDVLMPDAWRYRDYVIDAFNADIPFDRFLSEQVAGDLLPADSASEKDRLTIATGMLAVGSKSLNGGNLDLDIADDQIDVIGKGFLGLTISCARCHDHKFDPIPTADYYALAGIFLSTETLYGGGTNRPKNDTDKAKLALILGENPDQKLKDIRQREKDLAELDKQDKALAKKLATLQKKLPKDWEEQFKQLQAKLDNSTTKEEEPAPKLTPQEQKLRDQIADFIAQQDESKQIKAQLAELSKQKSDTLEFALGVRDAAKVADTEIRVRGDKSKKGDISPRGFLSQVSVETVPQISDGHSGRLELAEWMTQPDHPLTSRVIVNRVWQHLFGRGLVETVDNFGVNGTTPSHPELLDYLADRFMNVHRWSIKSLIRELVQTRTYQLSSESIAENEAADPGNVWLWKMNRRRLEAEPFRDAMLAISGELNYDRPHASAVTRIGEGEVGRNINTKPLEQPYPHRSVYLPVIRGIVPEFLKLFDLPEPSNPQGLRDATNVPAQSLFLMNSPFVLEQSDKLATRLLAEQSSDGERVRMAYRLCFAREPDEQEIAKALEFLAQLQPQMADSGMNKDKLEQTAWSAFAQALFASAEFRFLD